MSTTTQNILPKDATWDKQFKLGPFDYTYKTWLIILLVFVGVYVYFIRYQEPTPGTPGAPASYYYY